MAIAKLSIDIEARLANFERDLGKVSKPPESARLHQKLFAGVGTAVGAAFSFPARSGCCAAVPGLGQFDGSNGRSRRTHRHDHRSAFRTGHTPAKCPASNSRHDDRPHQAVRQNAGRMEEPENIIRVLDEFFASSDELSGRN